MKDNEKKFTLPLLPEPRTMRVRFRKVGDLQYISHLDLQRTFARVLVRAGLPLWYTKGFNPHIKMVFALPLPVGSESECEYLDIRLEREMGEDEIRDRLNAELTDELRVAEVYAAEHPFTEIAFAAYTYTIRTAGVDAALAARVRTLLTTPPLTVTKKTKSGEQETELTAQIAALSVRAEAGALEIDAVLPAGEGRYISPELPVAALREHAGILTGASGEEGYRILRRRVLCADGVTDFR